MDVSQETMKRLYTDMVRIRKLDEKLIACLMSGELLTFFHSCQGQEAPGAALCALLREDDYVFYQHRGHGLSKCLPKGMSAEAILAEHYGKVNGGADGFAGFHYADLSLGIPGMGGMVGGEFTLAAGVAIAFQLRGAGQVAVCCFGDGATGRGTFHEAMLMSATWKLPVVWFCENNRYQQWTCIDVTHPKEDIVDFGRAYDIPSAAVDGQDVMAVYEAVAPAVERAREGKGPTLLEAKTCRYRPHVEGFPDYSVGCEDGMRSVAEVKQDKERDPILLFREVLLNRGVLSGADIEEIDRTAELEMEEAQRLSQEAPYPGPDGFDRALYAE